MSDYPQDGSSVCFCYDYRFDVWLQNSVMCCILHVIGWIISDSCQGEQAYPQDGGHWPRGEAYKALKKIKGLFALLAQKSGGSVGFFFFLNLDAEEMQFTIRVCILGRAEPQN